MKTITKFTINAVLILLMIILLGFNANKLVILSKFQPVTIMEYVANDSAIWFSILGLLVQVAVIFLLTYNFYHNLKAMNAFNRKKSARIDELMSELKGMMKSETKGKRVNSSNISQFVDDMMMYARRGDDIEASLAKFGKDNGVIIDNAAKISAIAIWEDMAPKKSTPKENNIPTKDALHDVIFERKGTGNEEFDRRLGMAEWSKPKRTFYELGEAGEKKYDLDYKAWWDGLDADIADYLSVEK